MKFDATAPGRPASAESVDRRTRDRVARLILETGPRSAASLGHRLTLSPAAVRRHLDALVADGLLVEVQPRPSLRRGRGRPARTYALTDLGRSSFPHAYDDLATTALRYLNETGGPRAVAAFADRRAAELAGALVDSVSGPQQRASGASATTSPARLAEVLTAAGYASSVEITATGMQICQHHCPVAHVAAEFPELCQAETRAFARVLGTHVQRLATIAHGDGVCTTHVPAAGFAGAGISTDSHRFQSADARAELRHNDKGVTA